MADKKISALTGASTPLAGTEVLPIVQSGATVKVAVSDLTAGRAVNAASLTAISNTTYQIQVASGTGNYTNGGIYFGALGTSDPGYYGYAYYDQATETLRLGNRSASSIGGVKFYTGAGTPVDRGGVDTNGNLALISGNFVVGTTGKGIALSDFGGVRSFGWGNVSSISQDLSTLFDNVSFTNRGLSIQVQVITQSSSSAATSATFVGLRTPGGTWAFTLVNAASAGVNTITPSGSGSTLTLTFSVANQFGVALVTLISQS